MVLSARFASGPVRISSSGFVHFEVPGSFSLFSLGPVRSSFRSCSFSATAASFLWSSPGVSFLFFPRVQPLSWAVPSYLLPRLLLHLSEVLLPLVSFCAFTSSCGLPSFTQKPGGSVADFRDFFFYGLCRRLYSSLFPALLPGARKNQFLVHAAMPIFWK